jgi:hypothetical protein
MGMQHAPLDAGIKALKEDLHSNLKFLRFFPTVCTRMTKNK